MARDEFQHGAHHSAEKIMRKVGSKRSLQTTCSHSSSEEELLGTKKGSRSATPLASRSGYSDARAKDRTPSPGSEAVRGHKSRRTGTGVSSFDGGFDLEEGRSRSQRYTSQSEHFVDSKTRQLPEQDSSVDDIGITSQASRLNAASAITAKRRQSRSEGSDSHVRNPSYNGWAGAKHAKADMSRETVGTGEDEFQEINLRGSEADLSPLKDTHRVKKG
ncbi:hypothetical protein GGS20DRAFT_583564 [Poronia punctata]|nr:hypothetical protein GGS20DRAFT_583564 [Poronia punctata]